MNSQLREKVIRLRIQKELSYSEIRKKLGIPKSTLSGWLQEFPLSEEKILELRRKGWGKGEAARERFRITMREKQELKSQKVYEEQRRRFEHFSKDAFFVAGLMLYAAEGDKKNYSRISLANTDSGIVKFFIQWMIEFIGIQKEVIKVQLHLYENMNIAKEEKFWKEELGLEKEQFYKPAIRKLQKSSFSYKGSHRHGTCSIYVLGVERKREVTMAIKAFFDQMKQYPMGT